ncbi:MAG: Periplasmic binding protein domain containing protein [Clostridia bacterium]|jgi:simple sugar transport system substrate-binding protein|nr:Periplasmic binding protein domain containing protein [Clostridia bacterium]
MRLYNRNLPYVVAIIMILFSILSIAGIILYNNNRFNTAQYSENEIEFVIGVSQADLEEPWRIIMTEEIKEEAKKYPNLRVIYMEAAGSYKKQIRDINELKAFGVDLLIVSPTDPSKLTPIVSETYQEMPVIVLDRGIEGYDYTLYLGPDNGRVGKQVGEYIEKVLGKQGGNIVEIKGSADSHSTKERSEGFQGILKDYHNINIIESIDADWNRDRAEDKMYDIYKNPKKIDIVFAHSDAMALGAYRAYTYSNYPHPIKFIGVDGLPGINGGLDLVEKNILTSTYICPTGGKEALQYAMDILSKQKGIPKKIILRTTQITKDNLEEYKLQQNELPLIHNPNEKIVLGFCNVGKEGGWREANAASIKNAAKEADIELIYSEADLNKERQIEILRSFIKMKVDVISFSPVVESGWDDILKEAKAAGIPVIIADRMIKTEDDSLYTTFLGPDFREEGRRAARWVASNSSKDDVVNVVEIQGSKNSTPSVERKIGFNEIISGDKRFRMIHSSYGDFTFKNGKEIMKNLLEVESKYGSTIDVVYAHNDDMALGAIEAIEEFGFKPGIDIKIVSIDAIKQAILAIKDGKLNCSVECNPLLGPQLMKVIKDIEAGKQTPMMIITEETVFTQEAFTREWLNRPY